MKKLSILLMALLLAGGSAFAAEVSLSGDATFSVSFDLDGKEGGIDGDTGTTNLAADLELVLVEAASAESSGSGDIYAVLGVSTDAMVLDETGAISAAALSLDTFKVVAGDLTVDLLGATSSASYAAYGDYDDSGASDMDVAKLGLTGKNGGVGVAYAGLADLDLGLDFWYDDSASPKLDWFVFAGYSSEIADGITASVAAGYDNAAGFDLAAKADYAVDDYSLTVALDAADNFAAIDAGVKVDAVVDIVTIAFDGYYDVTGNKLYINNQNSVELDALTLGVDFFWNDINTYAGSAVKAHTSYALNDDIVLSVNGGYDFSNDIFAGIGADYWVNEDVMLYGSADLTGILTTMGLELTAGASSTSLIDNATTKVEYTNDDVLASNLGKVVASLTVSL